MVDIDPYMILSVLLVLGVLYLMIIVGYSISGVVNSKWRLCGAVLCVIGIMFSVYKVLLISGG